MPDGWEEQVREAAGVEWLLSGFAEEVREDGLAHAQIRLSERRAPGHVSPLTILVDAVDRNPAAVLEMILGAVRRLALPVSSDGG